MVGRSIMVEEPATTKGETPLTPGKIISRNIFLFSYKVVSSIKTAFKEFSSGPEQVSDTNDKDTPGYACPSSSVSEKRTALKYFPLQFIVRCQNMPGSPLKYY